MRLFVIIILILLISLVTFCCCSKFRVDNFSSDYSCEAVQNKYYHVDELLYKSRCPNLVIVEKNINGTPVFFAEMGDSKGPYFSRDHIRHYYLGISPDGIELNLDYDLYEYPWYNPYRWMYGPYRYYPRRYIHYGDRHYKNRPFRRYKNWKKLKNRERSPRRSPRSSPKKSPRRSPKRSSRPSGGFSARID